MRHEEQVRILRELLSQIDEKRNVDAGCQVRNPTSAYTDRELAAKEWDHFFANYPQLVGTSGDLGLIRIYPDPENPGRSITPVSHYFSGDALAKLEARDGNATFGFDATVEVFDSTIEQEDYRVGESTQRSAESGAFDHRILGRNEAALHHYHNTFRAALEMSPLDVVE